MPSAQTPQMSNEVTPQVQQITTRAPIHVVSPVKPYTLSNISPTLRKVRQQQSKVHGKKKGFRMVENTITSRIILYCSCCSLVNKNDLKSCLNSILKLYIKTFIVYPSTVQENIKVSFDWI